MNKRREALQQEKEDRSAIWQPRFVDPVSVRNLARLNDENEILSLYRALDNIFPGLNQKVILFLGAKGGEGVSNIVSNLARVAVDRFNHKVAILDAEARAGAVQVIDAPGMGGYFKALQERVDLIFIDGAPATVFPDSIALSRKADGVVLVVEAESTRSPVVRAMQQQIANAGGKVIGIVFNKRRFYIPGFIYRRL